MKQLSIEEKARNYDKAIERANSLLSGNQLGNAWIYKLLPELKESEGERIKEVILKALMADEAINILVESGIYYEDVESWLEKQCEHANFRNAIQIGDKVTRNRDGMLVNLSQLKRVAKPAEEYNIRGIGSKHAEGKLKELIEKQCEQKLDEISNVCEFSIETWIKIVDYVLTEHNGIGNYLIDPEVKDTAEKLQKKYKFDAASEEWDRVYRKGLDAGVKPLLEMVKEYDNILRFVDLISKNELTEFEKKLWSYLSRANLGKYETSDDKVGKQYVINCSKELLSIARKQIVNQIDVDAMIDAYDEENGRLNITSGIYRMGIEDTLDMIKSEKLK